MKISELQHDYDADYWFDQQDCCEIIESYYNPDSNEGGQWVDCHYSYEQVLDAFWVAKLDVTEFYYLLSSSRHYEYLYDVGTNVYPEYEAWMKDQECLCEGTGNLQMLAVARAASQGYEKMYGESYGSEE